MITPPALVDTNILCSAIDSGEPEKRAKGADLLSRCWRAEIALAVFSAKPCRILGCSDEKKLNIRHRMKWLRNLSVISPHSMAGLSSAMTRGLLWKRS